jgi:hypothetical protein
VFYELTVRGDEERGTLVADRSLAISEAKELGCEVWQLADDEARTRVCRVWPEPEPEHVVDLGSFRLESNVQELIRRADREASGIIARTGLPSSDIWHSALSLAWKAGYVEGYGDCAKRASAAFERLERVFGP